MHEDMKSVVCVKGHVTMLQWYTDTSVGVQLLSEFARTSDVQRVFQNSAVSGDSRLMDMSSSEPRSAAGPAVLFSKLCQQAPRATGNQTRLLGAIVNSDTPVGHLMGGVARLMSYAALLGCCRWRRCVYQSSAQPLLDLGRMACCSVP